MGLAALILGIYSLVAFFLALIPAIGIYLSGLGLITSIVGIILGVLGRKAPDQRGMATAGMIMSIVALALDLICVIACVACFGSLINELSNLSYIC